METIKDLEHIKTWLNIKNEIQENEKTIIAKV